MSSSQSAMARPPPMPGMETYREKATRKFKENPWVPLGSLATVAALTVAMVKMRRGQSQSFNHWLRVRVAAQGLTIVALVAGTYTLRPKEVISPEADPTLTRNDVDVERRRLEKAAKEKDEFEERMKGAQAAHDMETELQSIRRHAKTETTDGGPAAGSGEGGSWWGWPKSNSGSKKDTSEDTSSSKNS